MDITVIVCTYNRSASLTTCLAHLVMQKVPAELTWEVLVVDNNSTDGTDRTVKQLGKLHPIPIQYVKEGRQGLNHARNRGIVSSESKYFIFIDDDIVVTQGWLGAMHTSLIVNDADAVGGRIHLDKSLELPSWIRPDMRGFLGYMDLGEHPFQMDGLREYPFGGNMGFNRRVVEKIGFFNPHVGRKGAGQKRDELFKRAETEYFHRLAVAGGRIFYQPKGIVYHHVRASQLTRRYFKTIHYNDGYQRASHDQTVYHRNFYGIPLFLFPQLARSIVRYVFQALSKSPNWAFRQQMTIAHFLGMMLAYTHRRRGISATK